MFLIVGVQHAPRPLGGRADLRRSQGGGHGRALGNPALVLLIVKPELSRARGQRLVMAYILIRVVMMLPYNIWAKRKGKKLEQLSHTTRMDPGSALPRPSDTNQCSSITPRSRAV
jgi:hypothetical protein